MPRKTKEPRKHRPDARDGERRAAGPRDPKRSAGRPRDPKRSAAGPFARVYAIVRAIPPGRVMTYGQISEQIERRISAAAVGWALSGCPDDVPWHRVVNAKGGFSTDHRPGVLPGAQLRMLELEGVKARSDGTIDLASYRYEARRGRRAPSARRLSTR